MYDILTASAKGFDNGTWFLLGCVSVFAIYWLMQKKGE